MNRRISYKREQIPTAFFLDGIAADPPAVKRIEMPVVVVDQPKFVVHVFAREAEFVLFRHVAFRRDQTSVRPVFIQGAASARFPEEGGDVFHRVVHCSRDALSPASRSLPSASWTGRASPQVPRGPRCNCAQLPAFPRSSRTPPPAGSHGRGSARGSSLSLRTSLTSQSIFLISDCYNTQKLVSDN